MYIPPLIGLTVGGLISVIAPLTQAGCKLNVEKELCDDFTFLTGLLLLNTVNPARDFGPRLVAYCAGWKRVAFQGWWVYVLAPVIGAVVGAFAADKLYGDEDAINGDV